MSVQTTVRRVARAALALGCVLTWTAAAMANDAPLQEKWAPTKWGKEDRIGAMNALSPEMVLKNVKLIRTGKWATLGKVYQSDAPFFGVRAFKLTIPGLPTGGPFGSHELVYNDEFVATELGQVGTQFDGPGHIGIKTSKGEFFYNGAMLQEEANTYGLGRLGVEAVAQKGYVCRGVLLNAAALRGMAMLPVPKGGSMNDPGIVTDKDVQAMAKRQKVSIGKGDCVFLYTGHGNLWDPRQWDTFDAAEKQKRTAAFNAGEPGFGISACRWMTQQGVVLTGADTWAVEAVPGENTDKPFECHAQMQTRHGIWNIENLDFSQLLADNVSEFLFVWSPLKIKGATGSPGNPIALY
jgi:kynurenine formamidase